MIVNDNTKVTLGVMIIIVTGVVSIMLYVTTNLSSKDYVDKRLEEIKQHFDKESAEREKSLDYVRNRVDQIYEYLIEYKRRNK